MGSQQISLQSNTVAIAAAQLKNRLKAALQQDSARLSTQRTNEEMAAATNGTSGGGSRRLRRLESRAELPGLLRDLQLPGAGVEVGALRGEFAARLLDGCLHTCALAAVSPTHRHAGGHTAGGLRYDDE